MLFSYGLLVGCFVNGFTSKEKYGKLLSAVSNKSVAER